MINDPPFVVTRWRHHASYPIEYARLEDAVAELEWDDQYVEKIEFEGHVLIDNANDATHDPEATLALARQRMLANQ
jgi:hypothetical protein